MTTLLPSEKGWAQGAQGQQQMDGTPSPKITEAYERLRTTFKSGRTKTVAWRRAQIEGIRRMLAENSEEFVAAIIADLGRPKMEALLGDLSPAIQEADFALQHLESWMKPESVATPLLQQPARSEIIREPKGVVLNLAPWNFPVQLAMASLIPIVAAGNCCLLKPSEVTPHSEAALAKLVPKYLDPEGVIVVTGGVAEAAALLNLRWDHIFFTGNGAIGRTVLEAAAKHLTPCTLELGGKTPTVVLPGANIEVAARRIFSGKFLNAGQICVAPDYALVHKDIEEALVQEMRRVAKAWYTSDAASSASFGRIVNERHWDRINSLLQSSGGEVLSDGTPSRADKF
eukprot:CAMPEP_0176111206 /NCGR_PEP_ID=MMETSP0120_2-20121206/55843_1 /TAXON_ID=160619 /ORGANISM="Kryptoperidinium foliaceum, Strain CCMP 1326" /LENGTH=342 /DNA_ID=CAMNT_0017445419 /DNA_START=32 /DNA_END=1057 /DNA_ORIENTATION=+